MAWTASPARLLLATAAVFFVIALTSIPSEAGPNPGKAKPATPPAAPATPPKVGPNPNAKFIMHLVPYSTKNTCQTGRLTSPSQVVTKGDLFPAKYTCYVLVVDGSRAGISGCQFGISFNDSLKKGVDVEDWQECSLFNWPMPGWPTESLTGNLLTWNQDTDCDTTGIRVAGYFTVTAYSPDRLAIIPRPADNAASVATCGITPSSQTSEVVNFIGSDNMGFVEFGRGEGYNPWDPKQNLARLRKK